MIAETLKKTALAGLALAAAAAPAAAHVGEAIHLHPHGEAGTLLWALLAAGVVCAIVAVPVARALVKRMRK